jgi:hypothetical protein
MDLPVNAKAESRVLVPWEQRNYKNLTVTDSSGLYNISLIHCANEITRFQAALQVFWVARMIGIGVMAVMSGKLGGVLVTLLRMHADCLPRCRTQ